MAQSGFSVKFEIVKDNIKVTEEQLAKAIDAGLTECGMNMERFAKQLCPVGKVKGGTLRGSITYALDGDVPKGTYLVLNDSGAPGMYDTPMPKEGAGGRAVYVGTNVFYAPYVERGTSRYPHPRPFIEPSVVGHKDEHKHTLEKHLRDAGVGIK